MSDDHRVSFASPLWNEAHAACNGDRDDMWDWLEAKYFAALEREREREREAERSA